MSANSSFKGNLEMQLSDDLFSAVARNYMTAFESGPDDNVYAANGYATAVGEHGVSEG